MYCITVCSEGASTNTIASNGNFMIIQYTFFLGEIGHVTKCCPAHQVLDSYLQGCVAGVVDS